MSYLVAKDIRSAGSIALEHKRGNSTSDADYASKLARRYLTAGIEILTVGNFEVHAEYKPVTYVSTREEFEEKIEEMRLKETEPSDLDELIRRVADKHDEIFRKLIKYEEKDDDTQ